jgi:ribosomal protein L12E/L44/L45/RPP1/RPP2
MSIQRRIADLAEQFAKDVLSELRGSNLEDLVSAISEQRRGPGRPRGSVATAAPAIGAPAAAPKAKRGKGGRLKRRSIEQIQATLDKVVSTLKNSSMRAEQIQSALHLDRKEPPAVLKLGLSTKKLSKKGEKRATAYSVR